MKTLLMIFLMFLGKNITFGQSFQQITEADKKSKMLDKMCPKEWSGWNSPSDYQAACIAADKNPSKKLDWIQGGINYRQYLEILVFANNSMETWKECGMKQPFTVSNINWILTEGKLEQGSISILNDQAMNFVYDHKSKSFKWEKSSKGDYPNLIYFTFKNGAVLGLCKRDCNNIFVVVVKTEVLTKVVTRYKDSISYYEVPVYKEYISQQTQQYGYQGYYAMPYQQAYMAGFNLSAGISWGFGGQQYYGCPQTRETEKIYNSYYYNNVVTNTTTINNNTNITIDDHSVVIHHAPHTDPPVVIAGGPVTPPSSEGGPTTPGSTGGPTTPGGTTSGGNPITPGGGGTPYTPNGNGGTTTTGGNSNTPGSTGGPQTPNAPPTMAAFRPNRNQNQNNEVTASNSTPYIPRVERRQNEVVASSEPFTPRMSRPSIENSNSTSAPEIRAGRTERAVSNNQSNENYNNSRNNQPQLQSTNSPVQRERMVERNNSNSFVNNNRASRNEAPNYYQNQQPQRMERQQSFQQPQQRMERQQQSFQQPQQMMRQEHQMQQRQPQQQMQYQQASMHMHRGR